MVRYLNEISEDRKKKIRNILQTTAESEQQDVEAVKEWLKKQPHLPEVLSDVQINGVLRINKYSIEIAKQKIDMYYTMRSRFPEIYKYVNPNQPEMMAYADENFFIPMKTLTNDHCRVTIMKSTADTDLFDPVRSFAWTLAVCEIRLMEDFEVGDIFVVDLGNCGLSHLTKTNPMFLKQANSIVSKAYTKRVTDIHFINAPSIVDRFLIIFKSIINPKIAQRIHVHENLESLYKIVPRELLPRDYGGNAKSLKKLQEELKATLRSLKPYFDHMDTLKVDEKLRLEPLNDEFLGIQGNFKKLDVD